MKASRLPWNRVFAAVLGTLAATVAVLGCRAVLATGSGIAAVRVIALSAVVAAFAGASWRSTLVARMLLGYGLLSLAVAGLYWFGPTSVPGVLCVAAGLAGAVLVVVFMRDIRTKSSCAAGKPESAPIPRAGASDPDNSPEPGREG